MKAPRIAALFFALVFCAIDDQAAPLATAPHVDLRRYCGEWHEVARLPNFFERPEDPALAEYLPAAGGRLRVINTAQRPDGSMRVIRGMATPVPGSDNARLRVKLGGLAALAPVPEEGNYWILAIDPAHYQYALVGTPDRKFLWLLARRAELDRATAGRLIAQAKALGFATEKLIWDPQ